MIEEIIIEPYNDSDFKFLEQFLYEAIHQQTDADPLPFDIIYEPELFAYIDGFGSGSDPGNVSTHDHCIVARLDDRIVGAVWVRIFSGDFLGYGRLDANTPELSISILPEHRGKGIGKMLMESMIDHLRKKGYPRVSLSVSKDNRAFKLYQSLGFTVIKETGDSCIMVKEVTDDPFQEGQ